MEKIILVLAVTCMTAFINCLLLIIPYTLTVGRHFDQWFRDEKPIAEYYILFPSPGLYYAGRAITYGKYIVLPFLTKNTLERKYIYKDFDFKQHANKFHLIFSYVFIYQIVIMGISGCLYTLMRIVIWLMKNGIFVTTT